MARWSRNVGVFSLQLILTGIVLHRLLSLGTPVTLNLFLTALGGAALAVLLALGAFVAIWRDGRPGGGSATLGLFLGLAIMAWPAVLVPFYQKLPPIHDISTDTALPPSFVTLAGLRPADANPIAYPGPKVAAMQLAAYPEVRPMLIGRPVTEVWEVMVETVKRKRWNVVSATAPAGRGEPGYIEAVDRTLILGFYDDVIIRIDGDSREARVDIRSASRYGVHDFGRNAARIRNLEKEFQARLDATVSGNDRRGRGRRGAEARVPKRGKGAQEKAKARKR
jgi:hypothetical protein